jgi:glycosyltransferase involved in cell wall biosynthesis
VTGTVADVRPYLKYAAVAVAPLRLGRGIQNKVLEALAMGRPVVATPVATQGLAPDAASNVRVVRDGEDFVGAVLADLDDRPDPAAAAARRAAVPRGHDWEANLAQVADLLGVEK